MSFAFETGEKENRLEGRDNQRRYEGANRVPYGNDVAMGNSSRTGREDPRPQRTLSRERQRTHIYWILDEAVLVHYILGNFSFRRSVKGGTYANGG